MSGYALTPLAKADIFDTWSYIAEDNEGAATRVEQAIYDACAFVAEAPLRGHSRPDFTTRELRFWTLTRFRTIPLFTGQKPCPFKLSPFCMGKEIYNAS
jgi:plasmid stabilization system protein ParE